VDNDYLTRLIYEYNPHLTGRTIEVPEFRRDLYQDIGAWLTKKQAIAIVGLRRTGKTTLLRQVMREIVGKEKSIFFSFDEEETQKKEVLVFVLDYAINTLKASTFFLDEIHYVDDWEGTIKRYYDQKGLKFILSGSESLEISKAKATLAGRIVTFQLPPLTFREYLAMKGRVIDTAGAELTDFQSMNRLYLQWITEKEYFEHEFLEYLYKGAFPELADEEDSSVIRKYIYDLVVRKIIYQDIPTIFDIRRRDILHELFRYACESSSGLFDIQNLSRTFGVHYETVTGYLFYLRTAFLIRTVESYTRSPAKRARRNKKLYVVHPSIACAVLGYDRSQLINKILGQYVETLFIGDYFWRDEKKREIDAVKQRGGSLTPIEVKYQARIRESDTKNLLTFMNEYDLDTGVVVTKNLMKTTTIDNRQVLFFPAWLALLAQRFPS
jgi:predicted AAA+ superfamily ATPase